MPIKVKIDEDLPKAVTQLLQARGVSAEGVYEEAMSGWKDPDLWQVVQRETRFKETFADKVVNKRLTFNIGIWQPFSVHWVNSFSNRRHFIIYISG